MRVDLGVIPSVLGWSHFKRFGHITVEQHLQLVGASQAFDFLIAIACEMDAELVVAVFWKGVRSERASPRA